MKFNISYPVTGQQKCIEIDDDMKVRYFYDKRMGQEVPGETLGEEFKGYIFRISGGNDKQGFSMKQGVLTSSRIRLLLSEGHSNYRPRRTGERKRKSVRGCIIGPDIGVVQLVIVKKGDAELPGLTDDPRPRRLAPKRANHIRKLFALDKKDDVRRYVIRREIAKEGKPKRTKAPRIQRLITAERLRRKQLEKADKKAKRERSLKLASEYEKLIQAKRDEEKKRHHDLFAGKQAETKKA